MNRFYLLLPAVALSATLVACGERPADDPNATRMGDPPATARTDMPPPQARTDAPPPQAGTDSTTAQRPSEQTTAERVGEAVSDSTITAEVKSALAADPQLSALRIEVDTSNGVVTLTGPAPDEQAKSRATQIAAAPKGVMRVENRLEVKSS